MMPSISTAALPRVNSTETLKTQAVLQDLSISPSLVSSMQMPYANTEATQWTADGDSTVTNEQNGQARAGSRKRNKSDVVNPTSPKRRWGDSYIVQREGVLTVVERIEHAPAPSIARTIGDICCRIVTKNESSWLVTVSEDEEAMIQLDLTEIALIYEQHSDQHVFSLRRSGSESSQSSTFVFTACSSEECADWAQTIQAVSSRGKHEKHEDTPPSDKEHTPAPTRTQATASKTTKHSGLVYSIPPKITHLILVRHGHYVNAHVKNIADAHQVLSEMGRQQAKLTGEYLQQLYHRLPRHNHISIYHSDLTRAVETAQGICESFGNAAPIPSELLREGWPGAPFFEDQMPAVFRQPKDPQQDELDRHDQERMEEAFTKLFTENREEDQGSFRIVVCHANLIRYFLCRALRLDPQHLWGHFEINHCSVTRIDLARNRPLKVMTINETGHLPHSLITSSEDHL